jgi:hypothetical protein
VRLFVWTAGGGFMPTLRVLTDRDYLIQCVDRMEKMGGFAVSLGKAALLADQDNLRKLANAYPEYFIEGQALRIAWTQS